MRNLKKLLALILVLTTLTAVSAPASAVEMTTKDKIKNDQQAVMLAQMNLLKGGSPTDFVPDLDSQADRQTGIVMNLRLFGLEDEAQKLSDEECNERLSKFTDSNTIAKWAKNQVAYAIKEGFVKGCSDGTLSPTKLIDGKMCASLALSMLGYTNWTYENATAVLAEKGGLSGMDPLELGSKALTRGDLVGISFGCLNAKYPDGTTVIYKLVDEGVVDGDAASKAGLLDNNILQARKAVSDYEAAPLTTLLEVYAAAELGVTATDLVSKITDTQVKAVLEARIATHKEKVLEANISLLPPPPPGLYD